LATKQPQPQNKAKQNKMNKTSHHPL